MDRIKAVVQKEFIQILRDPRTLAMIVMMPLVQLILYGYAIDTDVKHMATAVYDEDRSPLSRRLIQAFEQSGYFDIKIRAESTGEIQKALDRGKVKSGLHIPPHFESDTLAKRQAQVQLLIDGTDSTPANAAMNTSQAIVINFMENEGLIPVKIAPIDYRPRLWYNPDLKSAFFMVPGVVGLLLQLLIPIITASAVVREKERGNLEQLLVTPVKPYELIMGKLIPYILVGLVIASMILLGARFFFGVPVRGSPVTLFFLTLLFLFVCLGFGLLVSTLAESQQQASQIIMLFFPPSLLLSGFIFPRESMPTPIYYVGYMIPLTYYLKIIRGIVLKGVGMVELWPDTLPLAFMAALVLTISILRFHKRLV